MSVETIPSPPPIVVPTVSPALFRQKLLWGTVAVILSVAYAGIHLHTGWYPHDEGQLGQAALRILEGELPHRDFDEMYTGGLSYLHALAFQMWGASSESMRRLLWLSFVPSIAAWYYLAAGVTSPFAATMLTCLAAAPLAVYPGPMPSWYNQFLAIIASVCFLQSLRGPSSLWLFAAGCCAGASILVKITGIYLVAGGLLFLVYREQLEAKGAGQRSPLYSAYITSGLAVFAMLSLAFSRRADFPMSAIHFSSPLIGLAALLIWREWTLAEGDLRSRMRVALRLYVPFLLGLVIPLLLLVLHYDRHDALPELYHGLFVAPRARLTEAESLLPPLRSLLMALPLGAAISLGTLASRSDHAKWMSPFACFTAVAMAAVAILGPGTRDWIVMLRNAAPFVLGSSIWLMARTRPGRSRGEAELFLVTAIAATCGLVQFPFATATYFFYTWATLLLCLVYAQRHRTRLHGPSHRIDQNWTWLLAGCLAFALLRLPACETRIPDGRAFPVELLDLSRCKLRIPSPWVAPYEDLVGEIESRSSAGQSVYAYPDFPEAHFLADRRNPTRWMYDFYQPDLASDVAYLKKVWVEKDVRLAVVKLHSPFSKPDPRILAEVAAFFPRCQSIRLDEDLNGERKREVFRVYWRD